MGNAKKCADMVLEAINRFLPATAEIVNKTGLQLSPADRHKFEFLYGQINAKHSELMFWLDNLEAQMKATGLSK